MSVNSAPPTPHLPPLKLVLSPSPSVSISEALFSVGSPPASWVLLKPPSPTLTLGFSQGSVGDQLFAEPLLCLFSQGFLIHPGLWKLISSSYLSPSFPGGSDSKESACNAGDRSSIPWSGKSPKKGLAIHSSILAWRIPWTGEPDGLQSMG